MPQLRLDELLTELQVRLQDILDTRDRTHALLEAVVAVGGHLDLEVVLRRIVEAAVTLVDARYGALGVIGEGGSLVEFVPVGLDESEIGAIDHWPEGRGLLGELITHQGTLRIPDMSADLRSAGFPEGHPPMRSFLGTPVRIREEIYGNPYLTGERGGAEFDEEDEARHAGATRVSIAVRAGPDLTLTVQDNGSRMQASGRRSGLGNLADRAG